MPKFVARIELNGPPPSATYDRLHEAMGKIGFYRVILGSDGAYYKLPDGLYVGELSTTLATDAHDTIRRYANTASSSYELAVFLYEQAAWSGLGINK